MDAAVDSGSNPVSKHQILPECGEWAGWHETGRPNLSRETKFPGGNGDKEIFPWSADHVVVVVVLSHIQRIGCQPEKTTLHGGQSRSWSAEQGKENKRKSLAAYPPPTPHTARSEKINKITRCIYRRYAGGRSRVRTRIPSARRLGLWVWLRKILHSRLR